MILPELNAKNVALGAQHTLAMFGSTVLVPLITGMSPAVALFTAGIGTLLFHLCTKGMVPVFQGSSFAFIPALCVIIGKSADQALTAHNIQLAQSGIIAAGLVYFAFALVAKLAGPQFIRKIFPPVVTGPVIVIIGLSLTGVGIKDSLDLHANPDFDFHTLKSALIALFTFCVIVACMNRRKGIFQLIPILIGIAAGYLLCLVLGAFGLFKMDFSPIAAAPWFNVPFRNHFLSLPILDWSAISLIAPIAIVTFMEHLGDITTNGAVVGKDFFKDPGIHRTLMGDGLASIAAGLLGGPASTTYSENTGVLATTKNYNPAILRLAACFAIILALFGKFGAFLQTIPAPVKGGIELVLFGMIAAIGIRLICEARLDMTDSRNLTIMAGTLCVGIGIGALNDGVIPIVFSAGFKLSLSGLFVATIVGVVMNLLLPRTAQNPATQEAKQDA